MIRLVIADDHQIVIDGLRHMLAGEDDISIVGEAKDGNEVLSILREIPVDVVLMDLDMPGMDGITTCKNIMTLHAGVKVIALTMLDEASIIRKMLEAGAMGYLMKNTGKAELIQGINIVASGGSYYSKEVADTILRDISSSSDSVNKSVLPSLSKREKQILQLIVAEMTTGEVAKELDIAFGTVETHRRNIMHKLGARNVVGIVRIAMENNLLD